MLVEFEIWHDCPNKCAFCSLGIYRKITSDDEKISNINKVIEIIKKLDKKYDEIALIGGELFTELNENVKNKFIELLNVVIEYNPRKCYIMSSLLNESSLIKDVIETFKNNKDILMINTSWDKAFRFNEHNYEVWKKNIKFLEDNNIQIHYETILTEKMIQSFLNDDQETLDILLKNVDIIRPSDSNGYDNKKLDGFFPKRSSFIKFLHKLKLFNRRLYDNLFALNQRASTLYIIPLNMRKDRDAESYLEDVDEVPQEKCGHSKIYNCFSDSNGCIICDMEAYKEEIDD